MSMPKRKAQDYAASIAALLSSNRTCFDCTAKAPSCINLTTNTFVCFKCAGFLRDFSHRIKTVSGSVLSPEEIQRLQGGNSAAAAKWLATWIPTETPKPAPNMPKKVQSFMRKKYLKKEFYWDGSVTTGSLRDSSKDIHAAVSVGALLAFNTGQQLAPPPKHKEILHGNSVIEPTLTAREEHSDDDFAEFISAFPSTPSTSKASQSTAPVKDKVDPYSDLFGLNWSTPVPASQEISIPQAVPEMHTPGLQSQETLLSCSADVAQTVTYDLVVTKNVAMPNMDDSSILSPPPANEPVTTVKKESDYDALRAMMEEDTVSALSSFEDVEVSIETPCFETLVNVAPSVDPFPVIDSLLDEEPSIQTNEHSSVEKEFSKSTLVDQLSTLSLGSDSAVKKGAVALSGVETASNPWDFPDKQAQTQFQFSFDNVWS